MDSGLVRHGEECKRRKPIHFYTGRNKIYHIHIFVSESRKGGAVWLEMCVKERKVLRDVKAQTERGIPEEPA